MMSSHLFLSYKEIPGGSNLNSGVHSANGTKNSVKGEGGLLATGAFSMSVSQIAQAEMEVSLKANDCTWMPLSGDLF